MICEQCKKDVTVFYYDIKGDKLGCSECATEDMKTEPYLRSPAILNGWQCPQCGSVYSPFTAECHRCVNSNVRYSTSSNSTGG